MDRSENDQYDTDDLPDDLLCSSKSTTKKHTTCTTSKVMMKNHCVFPIIDYWLASCQGIHSKVQSKMGERTSIFLWIKYTI